MRGSSKQEAGENSVQIVVHGDFVQGITETRAREIAAEVSEKAMAEYSEEAHALAAERIGAFDEILLDRLTGSDLLGAFRDPGFQVSLKKAQMGAASSEREDDYRLLSELLVERVERGAERPTRAGIDRAIEVVDKVDGDALRGLTMIQVVSFITPLVNGVEDGLDVMERVYAPILADGPLPEGRDWIDHLDILDAVRFDSVSEFKKFGDYFPEQMPGYVSSGVPAESEDLAKGEAQLLEQRITAGCVPHELKPGFVRMPLVSTAVLATRLKDVADMTPERETAILRISADAFGLTDTGDASLRPALMERALARPSIGAVAMWWDQIPTHVRATSVGRVLARANAQRCDQDQLIPDLGN